MTPAIQPPSSNVANISMKVYWVHGQKHSDEMNSYVHPVTVKSNRLYQEYSLEHSREEGSS